MRVELVGPKKSHAAEYVGAYARSRRLYRNLMTPVEAEKGFADISKRCRSPRSANFFVALRDSRELVGMIQVKSKA